MRSFIGHCGHGVRSSGRFAGGSPSTSIWVTDAACSRSALATQSAPVSPPPITMTCFPAAVIGCSGSGGAESAGRPGLGGDRAGAVVEVVHREVDAVELAPGHGQVARHPGARRDDDRVVGRAELVGADVDADVDAVAELDPLGDELAEPPLDESLLDLELRHAEADEPAARLVPLVDGDRVAGPGQLLGAGEPGRARADDGHGAAAAAGRRARHDPALLPGAVDDRDLDLLDRDRVALADLEHARRLARRRAETARELREVVRAVQLVDRLAPAVAVDEVVPVRDQVPERAAVMAERHPALHAARTLAAELGERQRADELAHVADALGGVALERIGPRRS